MTEEELEKVLIELNKVCSKLGWILAYDVSEDYVSGFVIGNQEYVETLVFSLDGEYEVEYPDTDPEGMIH